MTSRAEHGLAFGGRLQEGAGRQRDRRAAHADRRGGTLRDQLAVAGQPREPMGLGKPHQRGSALRRQAARAAHVDIEAVGSFPVT